MTELYLLSSDVVSFGALFTKIQVPVSVTYYQLLITDIWNCVLQEGLSGSGWWGILFL